MTFINRKDAGQKLGKALEKTLQTYQDTSLVVIALARGGIPVGYEVAKTLSAPLDVMVARKIGAPMNPELGIGAIAPGDVCVLNEELVRQLRVSEDYLAQKIQEESQVMAHRLQLYRGGQPEMDLMGKTVIIVDDGLATGITARAAIQAIQKQNPARLILAIPVCAAETASDIRKSVDELVCLETPFQFTAVGYWYEEFSQTPDEEVISLLALNRQERVGATPD